MRSVFCVLYGKSITVDDRNAPQRPGLSRRPISRQGYEAYVDQLIIWGYKRLGQHGPQDAVERWSRATHIGDDHIELLLEVAG